MRDIAKLPCSLLFYLYRFALKYDNNSALIPNQVIPYKVLELLSICFLHCVRLAVRFRCVEHNKAIDCLRPILRHTVNSAFRLSPSLVTFCCSIRVPSEFSTLMIPFVPSIRLVSPKRLASIRKLRRTGTRHSECLSIRLRPFDFLCTAAPRQNSHRCDHDDKQNNQFFLHAL